MVASSPVAGAGGERPRAFCRDEQEGKEAMKLTRLEDRWAEAVMGAIFPGSAESGLGDIRAMDVRGFLHQLIRSVPFQAAFGLRAAVWLVALAPLFVLGRFATIVGLTVADRERVLASLVVSKSY